jgi:hypothetical protein
MKKLSLALCPPPAKPAITVKFEGASDPVREVAWLRELIARARAQKVEQQKTQLGVESAA